MLSLRVTDTVAQTKAILLAVAEGRSPAAAELELWRALQIWLAGAEHRVVIPYLYMLADLTNPVATRLRRDFPALVSLISAHALLHQANRARDAEGRILANIDDYAVVRALAVDLITEGTEATVSATIRETVEALSTVCLEGRTVTNKVVAAALGLDISAARRRVKDAQSRGYIVNDETHKGQPAKLHLGEPLPEDQQILPTVTELSTAITTEQLASQERGADDGPTEEYL